MPDFNISNNILTVTDQTPTLVKHLKEGFNSAVNHRKNTGVEAKLLAALRQSVSEYDPEIKNKICKEKEPDVYFPLGAMKARAQTSWLKDTVANAIEKMWNGEPTPIPELPPNDVVQITDQVVSELADAITTEQVFNFQDLVNMVNNLTDEQIDRQYELAKERSDRMSRKILDQWVEGGWIDTWSQVISDLGRSPVAVIKGPIDVMKKTVKWTATGGLTEKPDVTPIMYRVAPEDFYPMADVTHDVNSGTGLYELARLSLADLHEAKSLEEGSYKKKMLEELIQSNPAGWEIEGLVSNEFVKILNQIDGISSDINPKLGQGVFHTIKYYGKVQVSLLKEDKGIGDIPDKFSNSDFVTIEAWVIRNSLIYLAIEPYPLSRRPFSVVPREFVAGSIWGGDSLQSMIETPARIVNALVRQHILNMGYAAGPIGEVDSARFVGSPPSHIRPRKLYSVRTGQHGERAIRLSDVPARTEQYINSISFYLTQADSLSGIPGFIEGTPGLERNSTFGQTQFYSENASLGMVSLVDLISRFLIEPMLLRFYYRNLLVINDDSIKGDVKWKVTGLSGVVAKQIRRDLAVQAVQLLGQLREVMPNYVTEESFLNLVRPIFENIGLDIDDILVKNEGSSTSPTTDIAPVVDQLNNQITRNPVTTAEE